MMELNALLERIRALFESVLGDSLTGIYVHGSIAFGCFCWQKSDVDFLAVVKRPPALQEKAALIRGILSLTPDAPPKGIEMSVVLEQHCRNFVHPAPYELHFSNSYLCRAEADPEQYCREMHGVDADLAAHFSVVRKVGQVLCGLPVDEVFGEVPEEDYLSSIRGDAEDADECFEENPLYFVLNLCRVLAFRREALVLSKRQGGLWGLKNLPERYAPMLQDALACYSSDKSFRPGEIAGDFLKYMKEKLKEADG